MRTDLLLESMLGRSYMAILFVVFVAWVAAICAGDSD